jgi:hypothetical protein
MTEGYSLWFGEVKIALQSINMQLDDWQVRWRFDFPTEYSSGADPDVAAAKANRFWWHQQNKSLDQDCQKTPNCWLPREHAGECEPV